MGQLGNRKHRLLRQGLRVILTLAAFAVANPIEGLFFFDDAAAGTAVLPFLKVPVGARASGMGSFDGPALSDPMVVFWNPARLPDVQGFQTAFTHSEYLSEWRHEQAATVFTAPRLGQVGVGFNGMFATPTSGARDIEENAVQLVGMDFSFGVAWAKPFLGANSIGCIPSWMMYWEMVIRWIWVPLGPCLGVCGAPGYSKIFPTGLLTVQELIRWKKSLQ